MSFRAEPGGTEGGAIGKEAESNIRLSGAICQ